MSQMFCTICSKVTVYQVVTLHRSLQKQNHTYQLTILCADVESYQLLTEWKGENVCVLSTYSIQSYLPYQDDRPLHEFCWMLKPIVMSYVLTELKIESVVFVDADMYVCQPVEYLFKNHPNANVLLTPENKYFPNVREEFLNEITAITGKYNSGFVFMRNSEETLNCLKWWVDRCKESTTVSKEVLEVFADQKYVEQFHNHFLGIEDVNHPGVNTGPWNVLKYKFTKGNEGWKIGNKPLYCYHFVGFKIHSVDDIKLFNDYDFLKQVYGTHDFLKLNQTLAPLYEEYVSEVKASIAEVQAVKNEFIGKYALTKPEYDKLWREESSLEGDNELSVQSSKYQ